MRDMKRRPWNDPAWVAPQGFPGRGAVRSVELMPDYGCELPLWQADWWELSLSTSLLNDLADWQEMFDGGFHETKGWRNADMAQAWKVEAEDLIARLRIELGGQVRLEIDLWPLVVRR